MNIDNQRNHRLKTKRNKLADVLPLKTPFVIHVDVSSACNFKCKFCFHGLTSQKLSESGFVPAIMDFELFKLTIEKIKMFPDKLKRLCLIRHGEALLNPNLAEMIQYAKDADVADSINISTNGALLTKEISNKLIASGIDEVLISVEAMSSHQYKQISHADIDFDQFVDNIKYFYDHKGDCKVHVKIVDIALEGTTEQAFYETFDNISDTSSVECVQPFFHEVDYSEIKEKTGFGRNLIGKDYKNINVCSQPFFQMHIAPNGDIGICNPDFSNYFNFGNVKIDSLVDVWSGKEWNEIRALHLRGDRKNHNYCSFCEGGTCYTFDEDILDFDAERLLKYYE